MTLRLEFGEEGMNDQSCNARGWLILCTLVKFIYWAWQRLMAYGWANDMKETSLRCISAKVDCGTGESDKLAFLYDTTRFWPIETYSGDSIIHR